MMVITGDNKLTAEAICREIGIFSTEQDISKTSITSKAFAQMSTQQQKDFLQVHLPPPPLPPHPFPCDPACGIA